MKKNLLVFALLLAPLAVQADTLGVGLLAYSSSDNYYYNTPQKKKRIPMSKDTPGLANRNNGLSSGIQQIAGEIAKERKANEQQMIRTNIDLYKKQPHH